MRLITILKLAKRLVARKMTENPSGEFKTPEGQISYEETISEIERVIEWVSPTLDCKDIVHIVRCKNCTHLESEICASGSKRSRRLTCQYTDFTLVSDPSNFYCAHCRETITK